MIVTLSTGRKVGIVLFGVLALVGILMIIISNINETIMELETVSTDSIGIDWDEFRVENVCIADVTFSLETGAVSIREGVGLDAAARKFWRAVEDMYPEVFEEHK